MRRHCALALAVTMPLAVADFYDVLSPELRPPEGGCKPWSAVPQMDRYWAEGRPPADAGSLCAQQGKGNADPHWDPANNSVAGGLGSAAIAHTLGSYCVSAVTGNLTLCHSAEGEPQQINVQIAGPDSVVLAFVTFEKAAPRAPPVARLAPEGGAARQLVGVTHRHDTPGNRTYYMHFVRAHALSPRATYSYTVKSGAADAAWSRQFSFRAPYAEGPTRIALCKCSRSLASSFEASKKRLQQTVTWAYTAGTTWAIFSKRRSRIARPTSSSTPATIATSAPPALNPDCAVLTWACNGSEGDADERRADGCKSSRCSLLRFHKPDEAVAQTCKPSSKRWPTRSGCLL